MKRNHFGTHSDPRNRIDHRENHGKTSQTPKDKRDRCCRRRRQKERQRARKRGARLRKRATEESATPSTVVNPTPEAPKVQPTATKSETKPRIASKLRKKTTVEESEPAQEYMRLLSGGSMLHHNLKNQVMKRP